MQICTFTSRCVNNIYSEASTLKTKLFSTCNMTVGSSDHITCCQAAAPTPEPTPEPTAAPISWERLNGCCREGGTGKKNGGDSHHDSVTVLKYTKTSLDSYESCKTECAEDTGCTAFEVHQVGKQNRKNKKDKKRNNYYKCELHTAGINGATRRNKSCKKASCTLKEQIPA